MDETKVEVNGPRFTITGDIEGYQVVFNVYDSDIEQLEATGENPFQFEVGIIQYMLGVSTDHGIQPFRAKGPTAAPVAVQAGTPSTVWSCPVHPSSETGMSFFEPKVLECKYKEHYSYGQPIPEWGKTKRDGAPLLDKNGNIWCKHNAGR